VAEREGSILDRSGTAGRQLAADDTRYHAEHWKHLRTTNVIESPFATVRLRERVTQGRRFANQGAADGVQAARHGPAPLAAPGWRRPPAAGPCRVKFVDGIQKRERNAQPSEDAPREAP
jgi:hypothetical protein